MSDIGYSIVSFILHLHPFPLLPSPTHISLSPPPSPLLLFSSSSCTLLPLISPPPPPSPLLFSSSFSSPPLPLLLLSSLLPLSSPPSFPSPPTVRLEETFDMSTTVKFAYIHWSGVEVPFVKRGKYGVVHGSIEKYFDVSGGTVCSWSIDLAALDPLIGPQKGIWLFQFWSQSQTLLHWTYKWLPPRTLVNVTSFKKPSFYNINTEMLR